MISKLWLTFKIMDDPGKKNLRFAIKEMALVSLRKVIGERQHTNLMNVLHERPVGVLRIQIVWKLFWQRADMKWHAYDPFKSSRDLAELIAEIDADPHGCFFG
ncbi:MAG: DUF3024 domain-containing protein [Thermodesulfobacteriota bacterium]|nr:DUF3024 domain-containing protein [Thermodesulfobacteriota bacterium]